MSNPPKGPSRPNHIAEKRYGPLVFSSGNIDEAGEPTPHMVIRHPRRQVTVAISEGVLSELLMPNASPERNVAVVQRWMAYTERLFGLMTERNCRNLKDAIIDYYPEVINVKPPADGPDAMLRQMARDSFRVNGVSVELH